MVEKTVKAYSYVRFSTPEQQKGDSYRRQATAAAEYARKHGLTLDESLTLHDLGVSAYRGANAETGALGAFLRAIEAGDVEPGSVLLVEALDRLSRRTARKALRILEDIVDAGVDVVTLSDGKRYTRESLDGFDLMMALLLFLRGNEESQMKSRRLKAAWLGKRERGGILTARVPGWLRVVDDRIELIEDRSAVVRRIFELFLAGKGKKSIAATLNAENVPPFGRAAYWHPTYVLKILTSPAVVGTYVPHALEYDEDGRRWRVPQEPVPGYYPPVIDEETFERAQALMSAGNPSRGRHAATGIRNVLAGLARCPKCGSTMTRVMKGKKGGRPFLVCVKAKAGQGCTYYPVRIHEIEGALTRNARELPVSCPHPDATVHEELEAADSELYRVSVEIENLVDVLSTHPSEAVSRRLAKLEEYAAKVRAQYEEVSQRAAATELKLIRRRAERLEHVLSAEKLDPEKANAVLRECFERVVIDYARGSLVFVWRHGGESDVPFTWPESRAIA